MLFWGILLPRLFLVGENYNLSLSNLHSDMIRTSLRGEGGNDDPLERTRGHDPWTERFVNSQCHVVFNSLLS